MAIVSMEKISIIGLEADKSQILKLLMKKGFVQIDDSSYLSDQEEFKGLVNRDSQESEVMEIEQKLYQVGSAIETISAAVKRKGKLFAPKRDFSGFSKTKEQEIYDLSETIIQIKKEIENLKNELNQVNTNNSLLKPWVNFDIPFDNMESKQTKVFLGTLPATADIGAIREKFNVADIFSLINQLHSDKQFLYCYIIVHKKCLDSALEVLKEYSFSPVGFAEAEKTVRENIAIYEAKAIEIEQKMKTLNEKSISFGNRIEELENLYDTLTIERDEKKAVEKLVKTKSAFCLNGWLAQKRAEMIVKELTESFDCVVETEKTKEGEDFPILLENNALVTPFESITNMYSCPGPGDVDPNPIMAFFYIIFFGMMLSDAGYGVIIAIACGFIVWKGKMKKGEGNLYKLLGICGISTTIWGIIFGSGFGDLIPFRAIISPLDDVMILMGMSLLFGILHIYVGLGIKAYNLIRHGHTMDALFDIGLWYLFITGICLLIVPIVAGDIGVFATIGKYLAIIGAAGLILTQGRSQKSVFMKGFKGFSSLYGITSYFADILSYSRLMALCLSTGVIGQVINLLGEIAGPVPAFFIGVIGHTANLLINALGAYVHTSRLQYVEFFGKFYEGGGIHFSPFKYRTKYTSIQDKEM